ncbi:MAG: hypothetical protein LBI42_06790 [Chitinispirillales bacterium]|jgi:Tol biopolymer transport system component|nr:hypothetical protein [Chitinispirillales bacterium]
MLTTYNNIILRVSLLLCGLGLLTVQTLFSAAYASQPAPGDWKTQVKYNQSQSKNERQKKREIAVIYSGNTKGQVIPYPPTPDALGGLSRGTAVIRKIRSGFPVNFSIDVGNMLDSTSNPLRFILAANYYDYMNFDIIAPSQNELAVGIPDFLLTKRKDKSAVVISNLNDAPESGIADGALIKKEGYELYVINMMSRSLNESVSKNVNTTTEKIKNILARPEARSANLRIAVAHASLEEIKNLAAKVPSLDIIIAGSLDQRFNSPIKIGPTLIVSAGSHGKFVGELSLRFDENKNMIAASNKLYPIYQTIAPDAKVEKMVRLVSARVIVDKTEKPSSKTVNRSKEKIPFVSDRNGSPQIFAKETGSSMEYSLSPNQSDCRKPVLSTNGRHAAFIFGPPEFGSLRIIELNTLKGKTVSSGKNVTEALFSPYGNFLYFIASGKENPKSTIYKTKMYMYDAITILDHADNSEPRHLSLSPDESTLLFCAQLNNRWQIFALDSSLATPPAALTIVKADHSSPRFSPNGKLIAYLSDRSSFGGKMDLWIMEKNGTVHRQITTHTNVSDYCWGGDSRTIYFSSGVNILDINSVDIREKETRFRKIAPTDTVKTWNEITPRFIAHKKRPRIIYTRRYNNGTRELRWFCVRTGRDNPAFKLADGNEWNE